MFSFRAFPNSRLPQNFPKHTSLNILPETDILSRHSVADAELTSILPMRGQRWIQCPSIKIIFANQHVTILPDYPPKGAPVSRSILPTNAYFASKFTLRHNPSLQVLRFRPWQSSIRYMKPADCRCGPDQLERQS